MVLALLSNNDGAISHTLMEATGWLPHTTRAALSVLRKGGLTIVGTELRLMHYRRRRSAGCDYRPPLTG